MTAYLALLAASKSTGMPHRFMTDLTTHDAQWLARRGEAPFAWALYMHGTHVIDPTVEPQKETRRLIGDDLYSKFVDTITNDFDGVRWYWWDGVTLKEHTSERVKELLAEYASLRATYECAWIDESGKRDVFERCTGAEWLRDNEGEFTAADLPLRVGEELRFGGGASPLGSIRRVS